MSALITTKTATGVMPVHVTTPHGPGPFRLVVLYMDAIGLRDDLHAAAARVADAGYLVALPDLFYHLAPEQRPDPVRMFSGDDSQFGVMMAAVKSIDEAAVVTDTQAMIDQLRDRFPLQEGPWACVGFCMGGRLGLRVTAALGERIAAASLLHPSLLVTDAQDSPHRDLAGVRAALYFGFGEADQVSPPSQIPALRDTLDRAKVAYEIEVLPDAGHGFMMPHHPAYNRAAADRAWQGTCEVLKRAAPPS